MSCCRGNGGRQTRSVEPLEKHRPCGAHRILTMSRKAERRKVRVSLLFPPRDHAGKDADPECYMNLSFLARSGDDRLNQEGLPDSENRMIPKPVLAGLVCLAFAPSVALAGASSALKEVRTSATLVQKVQHDGRYSYWHHRRRWDDDWYWQRQRYCERLRRACLYKSERGEWGQGNCRRYRSECSSRRW
jgi:hypothetical protein